jgi:hypothetical protein
MTNLETIYRGYPALDLSNSESTNVRTVGSTYLFLATFSTNSTTNSRANSTCASWSGLMTDAGEGGGGLLLSPPPPLCAKKPPDGWGHKPVLPTELPDQGHPHTGLRGCVTFARSKTLNYIETYDTRQGWPTSILSRAKTENFQTLRAAHIYGP